MDLIKKVFKGKWWKWVFSGIGVYIIGGAVSIATICFIGSKFDGNQPALSGPKTEGNNNKSIQRDDNSENIIAEQVGTVVQGNQFNLVLSKEQSEIIKKKMHVAASNERKHPDLQQNQDEGKNLNVLLFDATGDHRKFNIFLREFHREYPAYLIDSEFNWIEKDQNLMSKTLIFWQGKNNEKYAIQLEERLPGEQRIHDYLDDPMGFFGLSKDRDIIIFLGNDWRSILRGLRK
ncbi:hypothetical protein VU12_05690 [Desulfobulbus sp. US4]|nr:hypothetical protein [Desulfobulbus sp. US4]